jgi:hypothetical protein
MVCVTGASFLLRSWFGQKDGEGLKTEKMRFAAHDGIFHSTSNVNLGFGEWRQRANLPTRHAT